MPSDNLENFLKEKIKAVEHVPPRGSNWDPEAAWLKLPQIPAPARRKKVNWLQYAAAVFVCVLLSGLVHQYWPSAPAVTAPVVATTPAKEILPNPAPPAPLAESTTRSLMSTTHPTVIPEQHKAEGGFRKKRKHAAETTVLPLTDVVMAGFADTEQEVLPGSDAKNLVPPAVPATTASPLKITVVLGSNSSAKMAIATADKNLTIKKRKRLYLTIPEPADKNYLAATDSAYKPLTLQARIDL